jgi:arylsulfatase A-like enzyme
LRGGKYSIYEGGTRVPFILRWPGHVTPGVSDALVCLMDLPASFAALTGQKLAAGDALDSRDVLPAMLGESKTGREKLVEHDGFSVLGFRDGLWKFISPKILADEPGRAPKAQLYELGSDLGERYNLAADHPEKARELSDSLEKERQK